MMEPRCTCKNPATVHAYGRRNGQVVRTYCTASGCDCKRYEPDETEPASCPTCGATWAPTEAARAAGAVAP